MDDSPGVRCDICGGSIALRDLDESRAMKVLGKNYCPECLSESIKLAKDPQHAPDHRTPPRHHPAGIDRRRHARMEADLRLEVRLYLSSGRLYDRGTAVMRNVSLSGALLTGVILTGRSIVPESQRIGIRLLEGPLQETEILGRVVRFEPQPDGFGIALEFDKTAKAVVEHLRKVD